MSWFNTARKKLTLENGNRAHIERLDESRSRPNSISPNRARSGNIPGKYLSPHQAKSRPLSPEQTLSLGRGTFSGGIEDRNAPVSKSRPTYNGNGHNTATPSQLQKMSAEQGMHYPNQNTNTRMPTPVGNARNPNMECQKNHGRSYQERSSPFPDQRNLHEENVNIFRSGERPFVPLQQHEPGPNKFNFEESNGNTYRSSLEPQVVAQQSYGQNLSRETRNNAPSAPSVKNENGYMINQNRSLSPNTYVQANGCKSRQKQMNLYERGIQSGLKTAPNCAKPHDISRQRSPGRIGDAFDSNIRRTGSSIHRNESPSKSFGQHRSQSMIIDQSSFHDHRALGREEKGRGSFAQSSCFVPQRNLNRNCSRELCAKEQAAVDHLYSKVVKKIQGRTSPRETEQNIFKDPNFPKNRNDQDSTDAVQGEFKLNKSFIEKLHCSTFDPDAYGCSPIKASIPRCVDRHDSFLGGKASYLKNDDNAEVVYEKFSLKPHHVLRINRYDSVPMPVDPLDVVIKVEASTVSRLDTTIRSGCWHETPELPATPGFDCIGIITKCGTQVHDYGFKEGDRVVSIIKWGGNSRYLTLNALQVIKVPIGVDPAEGACIITTYMTAYQCLHRVRNKKHAKDSLENSRILVVGGNGAVGQALIQLALKAGAETVFATASEKHHDLLKYLGAYALGRETNQWLPKVKGKMDIVIDLVCADGYYSSYVALKKTGQLICTGAAGHPKGGFSSNWWSNVGKSANFMNKAISYDIIESLLSAPLEFRHDLIYLLEQLRKKKIKPNILARIPLEEVADAHAKIQSGGLDGSIVCLPWSKKAVYRQPFRRFA